MALSGHTEQCCLPQGWWADGGGDAALFLPPDLGGFWYLHCIGAAKINPLVLVKCLEDEKRCENVNYY